ncbi:hypothetical protein [Arcobacter arenosus]|jgi:hypothetical protein|uniref:hypothetical protein n=1 Tax=Arcobacter arenosus TaxID=2576037 RepID=UPI003BAC7F5D
MKRVFLFWVLVSTLVFANDYEFSFDELETIETKSYEYSGYIEGEYKYQTLNKNSPLYPSKNKNSQNSYFTELFFNYKYFLDKYTFNLDLLSNYENIDQNEEFQTIISQGFINYKYNENHQIYLGKKTPKWGKGYYINPIAFIDRKKDPNDPEGAREGFTQINYQYNKVLDGSLKNISFDAVYLKVTKDINDYFYNENDSDILAFKTYFLYNDVDIDLVYLYNSDNEDKFGFDFSTNIQSNFEIHGEYGIFDDGYYSYLLGLKYLTESELTILSEFYYQNEVQSNSTAFWDKKYFVNSFTQKEPLDILYTSLYYKNIFNINDKSHQNKVGILYSGIKNLDIDFSISKNIGNDISEYGKKLVDENFWLRLKYSF